MSFDVRELDRVAMQVVVDDDLVLFEQPLNQVRADEAGAAGDTDAFVGESHRLDSWTVSTEGDGNRLSR
jgi:hypothetical protein